MKRCDVRSLCCSSRVGMHGFASTLAHTSSPRPQIEFLRLLYITRRSISTSSLHHPSHHLYSTRRIISTAPVASSLHHLYITRRIISTSPVASRSHRAAIAQPSRSHRAAIGHAAARAVAQRVHVAEHTLRRPRASPKTRDDRLFPPTTHLGI